VANPDPTQYLQHLEQASIRRVEVGHQAVELLDGEALGDAQLGFAVGPDGEDLTSAEPHAWKAHWLVIAIEESLGDPIFLDTADPALPVYTVGHDMDWSAPHRIADSFEGFVDALHWVHETAGGETTPVELEQRPLSDEDLERLVARVINRNPNAEEYFWRSFFRFGED
jgi:hypothetical protein